MAEAKLDAGLATALKQAASKKMFFAFIPKGAAGKLIVSKSKIPPKQIAEIKKETGGGNPVTGKCFGPVKNMVFLVAKAPPATLGPAIKKAAHDDAGLTIAPEFQVTSDADADEEGTGAAAPSAPQTVGTAAGAAAPTGSAPAGPAAPTGSAPAGPADPSAGAPAPGAAPAAAGKPAAPAAGAKGDVTGIQKALQKLGYDPGKIDGIMGPHTEAALKNFQQASGLKADGILGPKTQAALAKALQGGAPATSGEPAASGAKPPAPPTSGTEPTAADSAKTPPPPVPGDAAAGAASAPQAPQAPSAAPNLAPWKAAHKHAITELKTLAAKVAGTKHRDAAPVLKEINAIIKKLPEEPALTEIDKLEAFISKDESLSAAEQSPKHFHHLNIRKPLLEALATLKQ